MTKAIRKLAAPSLRLTNGSSSPSKKARKFENILKSYKRRQVSRDTAHKFYIKKLKEIGKPITAREFAEKLGVERDKISRIENGKQGIDLNLLINIGQQFNVDLHWLITGESFRSEAEEQLKVCAEKLGKLNYYVERLESLINKN